MPSRVEDYEVLHTIGTGSYGKCQKIRRKSDGKVSNVKTDTFVCIKIKTRRVYANSADLTLNG